MPKLRTLPPRVATLAPTLGYARGDARATNRYRRANSPSKAWYNTAWWKQTRLRVLVRDLFTCQMCGTVVAGKGQAQVDHIEPHNEDRERFFCADDGLQTLCATCHASVKQREERRGALEPTPAGTSGAMARPSWFRKACIPLTIVCGPPGAGKSTFVRKRAGHRDLVVCFDQIATALFGKVGDARAQARLGPEQIADVLRRRNDMLGAIMRASARDEWDRAWLILTEPKAEHRQWWSDTTGADVIVLATPVEECQRRMQVDAAAGDVRGAAAIRFAAEWWQQYSAAACDRTVR